MAAGIPAIVTESTGLKEFIEPVEENMVSGSSSDELLETIENFYEFEEQERARIAETLTEAVQGLTEESSKNDFSQEVSKII
ncbi:MAG: glycosyltransferase [Candidatus Nanohaloarchaea archaeon]